MPFKVENVVKLTLFALVLIWLATSGTARLAEYQASKVEKRLLEYGERERQRANEAEAKADSMARGRDSIVVVTKLRTVYVRQQIQALPPAITPSDTLRDAVIATQDSIITDQRKALDAGVQIEAALRGALSASNARGDSLLALIQRPRRAPSKLGVSAVVGPCVTEMGTSKLCASVGIAWKIL
jgi:hypothetical protein